MDEVTFQNLVLEKFEKLEGKMDDLCGRTTTIEERLKNHLENTRQKMVTRREAVFAAIGACGVITAIAGILA